jgi:hypothetical protein
MKQCRDTITTGVFAPVGNNNLLTGRSPGNVSSSRVSMFLVTGAQAPTYSKLQLSIPSSI